MTPIGERDTSARTGAPMIEGLPYTWDDVACALEQEMALTLSDVLERRTHITWEARDHGMSIVPQVADRMGAYLGWDKSKREAELRAFEENIASADAFRG